MYELVFLSESYIFYHLIYFFHFKFLSRNILTQKKERRKRMIYILEMHELFEFESNWIELEIRSIRFRIKDIRIWIRADSISNRLLHLCFLTALFNDLLSRPF